MAAPQNDPAKHKAQPEPESNAKTMAGNIRRANLEELARVGKEAGSKGHSLHETMEKQGEVAAMEGLERLLRFQESLQSKSGNARQLRDFARLNEGTRAAKDAKLLAANADGE